MSVKLGRVNTSGHVNEAFECDDDSEDLTVSAQEKKKNAEADLPPVSFLALFRFASLTDRLLLIAAVAASAINGLCFPFLVILMGDLTNAFVSGGINQTILDAAYCNESALPPGFDDSWLLPDLDVVTEQFTRFGINVSIIAIVLFILGFVFVSALNFTAENQVYRMRSRFFQAIIRQDIAWYDTKISNDFASRITEDLIKVQDGIGDKIGLFILSATNFVAAITNAFLHGWELTLVILAATPVLFIAMSIVAKVQTTLTENELKAYAESGGVAEEVLSSIRTVVAFGGQEKEAERYEKNLVSARKAGVKRGLATGIGNGLVWGIIYANYGLAFWYGLTLILDSCGKTDAYTASDLLIVFFSVLLATMQIGRVSPYIESFSIARGSAATIFDIIDRIPAIDSLSKTGQYLQSVEGRIAFEKVRFNYPSRPQVKILQGISLKVEPGQTVALVGASGCGKSTCIQLLQRFYDPLEGRITIDGHDVKDLNLGWLREQIGIVSQEPCLFGVTIGENIRYGRDGVTQEEVENAAREANAHDFIMRLPLRYETKVGERGTQLSGGQKQRIAIARALVRNPKILLLDEATSALDTRSESVVQTALEKASRGRTTIIVAHRLSTIRNADRILALKEGIVEEDGTHETLMDKQGVYYKLVSQQGSEKKLKSVMSFDDDEEDDEEEVELETTKEEKSNLKIARRSIESVTSTDSSSFADDTSSQLSSLRDDVDLSEIMKMNRPEWKYITLGVIGSTLVGLSAPAYAIIFGNVLGVLRPAATEEQQAEQRAQGNLYSLMFLILGIIVGFSAFFQSFSFSVAGERLTSRLRGLAFRSMLKQEIGWFDREKNSVGSLCARLSGDASSVQGATGSRIGVLFQAVSTMASSIALSLYYEWKLGLTAMTFVPLLLASYYLQARVIMGQTAMELDGLQKSSRVAMEAISNIRTVAGLGRENQFHKLYMDSLRGPHRAALRKAWIRGVIFGASTSLPMFAYAATMYYGGWLVANEGLDFTNVFKVSQSLLFGTEMVAQAAAYAPSYNRAKVAAGRIFSLLGRVPQIDGEGFILSNVAGHVDFDSVKFRYPTRKNIQVLRGLSLCVRAGQTVALVGASGCGKSTCIQLLERFYDPDAGKVNLDKQNIQPINTGDLRSHLGLVSQEPVLFNRTIGDNIAYGDNNRNVPMIEIIEAARKANIHTFIQSLPRGYETMVGERGTQLSGGQKQRVAIARALLRNPKILLLDEATSALDSESEKIVQAALDAAREGRTCITIAHRLSTIRNADNIVVMDQGLIREQGTHEELIHLKGYYYELCTTQGIVSIEQIESKT